MKELFIILTVLYIGTQVLTIFALFGIGTVILCVYKKSQSNNFFIRKYITINLISNSYFLLVMLAPERFAIEIISLLGIPLLVSVFIYTKIFSLKSLLSIFFLPGFWAFHTPSSERDFETSYQLYIDDIKSTPKNVWKDTLTILKTLGVLLLIILVIAFYFLKEYSKPCGVVKSVGGCDLLGNCGVVLENGRTGTISKPVRGKYVCIDPD